MGKERKKGSYSGPTGALTSGRVICGANSFPANQCPTNDLTFQEVTI